jgi:hypothetical protein
MSRRTSQRAARSAPSLILAIAIGLVALVGTIAVGSAGASTGSTFCDRHPRNLKCTPPPPPPPPAAAACADGLDNDGDGLIDYPADPGCTSASDNDETNAPAPPPPPNNDGQIRLDKELDSNQDTFLQNASNDPSLRPFWKQKYDRVGPVFDWWLVANARNAGWLPDGWEYEDAYAVYKDSSGNPEPDKARFVLRDANGKLLYIPFNCSGGTCPQFAANVCDPAWQTNYINRVINTAALYGGTFMDDTNFERMVSDGGGNPSTSPAPINYLDGTTLTQDEWDTCMADFVVRVQNETSGELAINTVFFHDGGISTPDVARGIDAANVWNIERGFNDGGLTGGTGTFSFARLMNDIDTAHRLGTCVIVQPKDNANGSEQREIDRAAYWMISNGCDYVTGGDDTDQPTYDSAFWDHDIGASLGSRFLRSDGVWQRDFAGGTVYLNPPGNGSRTGPWGSMPSPGGRLVPN